MQRYKNPVEVSAIIICDLFTEIFRRTVLHPCKL